MAKGTLQIVMKLRILRWEDYTVEDKVLRWKWREVGSERKDTTLLAVKMEEGAVSQGILGM